MQSWTRRNKSNKARSGDVGSKRAYSYRASARCTCCSRTSATPNAVSATQQNVLRQNAKDLRLTLVLGRPLGDSKQQVYEQAALALLAQHMHTLCLGKLQARNQVDACQCQLSTLVVVSGLKSAWLAGAVQLVFGLRQPPWCMERCNDMVHGVMQ